MSKITTADCVAAIKAREIAVIPAIVADFRPDWKRLSKTGRRGEPVVRVFSAPTAPFMRVIVTETNGALDVVFSAVDRSEIDIDAADIFDETVGEDLDDVLNRSDVRAILVQKGASEYVYAVTPDTLWKTDAALIIVTPLAYWKKEGYAWDQHLDIAGLLPRNADGSEAGAEMEATFSVMGKTVEQVEAEMKALGFVDDPKFKALMAGGGS